MKVLMIEPSGKRGLCQYTHNLANALVDAGVEVVLVTPPEFETGHLSRQYRVIELFWLNPFGLFGFLRNVRRENPDLVHIQGAVHPALYLLLWWGLRALVNCPLIYTAHEIRPIKWRRINALAMPYLLRCASLVIVHARANQRYLIDHLAVPEERVKILSVGNNMASLPLERSSVSSSGSGKTVLFFGIISPRKGLMSLIDAFPQILSEVDEALLLIVGQPFEDVDPYRKRIRALGLENITELQLGYVPLDEVPGIISQADVVVLPYQDSSQSGVVLSAYACGVPVVATDVGGIAELIEDGESGLLCPPQDMSLCGRCTHGEIFQPAPARTTTRCFPTVSAE